MVRRRNSDDQAATELVLYIENDSDLYRGITTSIMKNLLRKMAAGKYNHSMAPRAWEYVVEAGAKKYAKEYSVGSDWHTMFPASLRRSVAKELADSFRDEVDLGNYSELASRSVAKKYAGNKLRTNPNRSWRRSYPWSGLSLGRRGRASCRSRR